MTDIAANSPSSHMHAKAVAKETWDADAGFYLIMALVSAAIIFAGFAPSFYLKSLIRAPPPLTQLTVIHGVVFTAWILLFITQVSLIARKQPALHRQLGIVGAILFGAMVPLGLSVAITAGRLGHAPPGAPPALAFMALPVLVIVAALILVGMALWNRRRSDWHKRLMLASVFVVTGPGTGRIAIPIGLASEEITLGFVITEMLCLVAFAYDYRVHKRVHPAYWVGATAIVALHVGVEWAIHSPTWIAFARAITQT